MPQFMCSKAEQPHKCLIGVFIMCKQVFINNAAYAYAMWCGTRIFSSYSFGIYLGMVRLVTDTDTPQKSLMLIFVLYSCFG